MEINCSPEKGPEAALTQHKAIFNANPDTPTLAFFGRKKKSKGNPEQNKGFSLCGNAKILGKERKNAPKKARKIGSTKKARKSKKARVGGSGKRLFGGHFGYLLFSFSARGRKKGGGVRAGDKGDGFH